MASDQQQQEVELYKILVVGDYAVGKTSLIRRFCTGEYSSTYRITIGVDFSLKTLDHVDTSGIDVHAGGVGGAGAAAAASAATDDADQHRQVQIQLWDIAGHERFTSMTRVYYKYALGALVVFDVTRPSTLENCKKWISDINNKVANPLPGSPNASIPMLLLGNKCDMIDDGSGAGATGDGAAGGAAGGVQVDHDRMKQYVSELQGVMGYELCSAKNNVGVEEGIMRLVREVCALGRECRHQGVLQQQQQQSQQDGDVASGPGAGSDQLNIVDVNIFG